MNLICQDNIDYLWLNLIESKIRNISFKRVEIFSDITDDFELLLLNDF